MRKHRIAGLLFAALLAAAAGTVQALSAWKPDRNVELLIASTAARDELSFQRLSRQRDHPQLFAEQYGEMKQILIDLGLVKTAK